MHTVGQGMPAAGRSQSHRLRCVDIIMCAAVWAAGPDPGALSPGLVDACSIQQRGKLASRRTPQQLQGPANFARPF